LLGAVDKARTIVREWPAPPEISKNADKLEWFRHDQLEAALDITLFARHRLPAAPPLSSSSKPTMKA
jgi:hypothetical protein